MRKVLAFLTALVMILGVLPGISFAAEGDSLKLVASYTSATTQTGYVMDNFPNRPYALSWAGSDGSGYRMGVVAFSVEGLGDELYKATLKLKISRIQDGSENTIVSVYPMDPSLVDTANIVKPGTPVAGTKLATIPISGKAVNGEISAEIDLARYFELYPEAETIALLLANRDDVADCNVYGLVGFYGLGDAGNEPQLVPIITTTGRVEIRAGGAAVYTEEIKGLVVGEEYTPDSSIAPEYLVAGDKLYSRSAVNSFTVDEDVAKNVAAIEYEPVSIFKAFVGVAAMLPAEASTFTDNKLETVKLTWSTEDDVTKPGTVTYTSDGISVQVEVVASEYSPEFFYCSGSSNGANFGWKTDTGYTYGGGNAIFEAVFNTGDGTNRLISYGNAATNSFDGAGPIMRYMNAATFEYHDGDWKQSAVPCEANKTYRLLTVVDMTNKTYQMYVAEGDSVESYEITDGPAKFRNQNLAYIDRFFYHGDDLTQGESGETGQSVITAHYEVWVDGWTQISVRYVTDDNKEFNQYTKKWATGTEYYDYEAPKAVALDGNVYITSVYSIPSLEIVNDYFNSLTIVYHKVDADPQQPEAVNTVVGQPPVLPSAVTVDFSDGQSLELAVAWDDVDVTAAGTKTVTGKIADLDMDVTCIVNVKAITVDYSKANEYSVATNNGGWNWYVEPSGTHIQPGDELATRYESGIYSSNNGYKFQHDRTYMGWVEDDGTIVVSQYDHDTDEYKRVVIHEKLESDDHNNPAVVILPDGRIMAVYTMHTNEPYMYFRVTKNPEDISEWHAEQFYYCETDTDMETGNGYNATYPTIFLVHDDEGIEGNDVIYAGWRGVHWKPTMAKFPIPDENGRFGTQTDGQIVPVMGQTQIANTSYYDFDNGGRSDSGRRPYTKYDYDVERNKIYITFTANHPDNDKRNHIYYFYLNIADQNLYTAKDNLLQPLPKENQAVYKDQGAVSGSSGQWGVETLKVYTTYPELVVFDASYLTGAAFDDPNGLNNERRGWTWDIAHNDKGEPCIVYADITATPPGENGALPGWFLSEVDGNTRTYHYYWYARWDSETEQWVNTYLTYAGKWFHQNATQERCYSGGLTFDHNYPGNVIYLSIPTEGKYGNVFEIYRWETDDYGATWTKREALTQDSPTPNARPNAIYNYKMNEDGSNAGPRLLWISGEYRYWMNYEYKTGVKTDFPGMITQDDPEMFAAVSLTSGGVELEKLPGSGNEEITAKFNISNISIGDGKVKLALAHYGADGSLKGIKTVDELIPARSVPQTSVLGADKDDSRANGLSTMGEEEVVVRIDYAPENGYAIGDSVKLFAWNMGIERQLNPIMEIPYEISTSGSRYLFSDYFTYEGDDKLVLTGDEATTYNGWIAKAYSGNYDYNNDWNYVAVTKAPFGNTGLHIYRHGDGGLMVSHSLPDTNGKDYTLEFTMRHIDEWSWNDTDNQGFTLSHGIPTGTNDSTNSHSAFQYRYGSAWRDENGRGTSGRVRNSLAFDGGSQSEIFHNVDLDRDVSDPDRYERVDYSKGEGYYDKQEEVYIHDYNDALYTGSLFRIKVNVHPATEMIEMSVNDGYRTAYYTTFYNSGYDWESNPIDTITFSIGNEKWGEVYIDDFRMYLSDESVSIRNVTVTPVTGPAMAIGSGTWNMLPMGGSYVFFDPADSPKVMEVYSQSLVVGGTVGTWEYNGGDNQKFYLEDAVDGYYYIRGKQSGLYLGVSAAGAVTLQAKANATVFAIEDTGDQISAAFLQLAEMIEDGTYIPTMDAVFEE